MTSDGGEKRVGSNRADNPASGGDGREAARLTVLEHLDAVRPEADHVLQELVDEVRGIFGADLCMVNLILSDVLYFRAWSGDLPADAAEARRLPREQVACRHVMETEAPLVVEDFLASEQYKDDPTCTVHGIRFYAGTPLITSGGHTIGTFCLLNTRPMEFGEDQIPLLAAFAKAAVGRLELLGALGREQAAREEEVRRGQELRRTLDASSDIIATIDADGAFKTVNRAAKTVLGYEPEELIGRGVLDVIHPDDRDAEAKRFAGVVEGGAVSRFESRALRKDGGIVWGEVSAVFVPEEGVMHCVVRDITERKRAEERLVRQAPQAALRAQVSAALAGSGDLRHILRQCTESMVENLGAAFARIWTLDEEESVLELRASSGMYTHLDGPHGRVPVGEVKIGRIAQERVAHLTNDLAGDPRVNDREWAEREGMVAFAGYPLVVENRLVGVAAMFAREPLTQDAIEALASVADAIAQGIQRKRAEEQLREAEARFRSAFDDSAIGMVLTRPDGSFMRVNRALCGILGYSAGELTDMTFLDVTHPEDARETADLVRRALAGEIRTFRFEKRYVRKDGHVVWVALSSSLVRDGHGDPLHFTTQVQDITERKRAEEEIERLGRRNELILNSAGEGIFGLDPRGDVTFANPAAAAMLGYEVEELVGRPMHDTIHHTRPDGAPYPSEECPIYAALGDGATHHVSSEVFWRKDGASFPVEYVSNPIREHGEIVGAVVSFEDVTERRQAEVALRESESRFRQLFDGSVEALLIHDETGRMVDCNREACRSLGYSREEMLSLSVQDFSIGLLSDEERRARGDDTLWRRTMAREPGSGLEGVHLGGHRRKDGTTFPVEVYVGPVDYGGRRMILASVRDITERKRAEEALRESEARNRAVVDSAFDAIVTATPDGLIESFNRSAERTFGYTAEEAIGESLTLLMPERFRAAHEAGIRRYLATGEARALGRTRRFEGRRKDGTEFPIELTIAEMRENKGMMFTATIRDVTERQAFEEQLAHQAFHDALTGLPNRALFMNRLEHTLAHATRHKEHVAVLFLDLDNFKVVNDSLGHEAGDRLLVAVAERLRTCLRPGDTLARLGGDEFTVLLEDAGDVGGAVRVAERIVEELRPPFTVLRGHELFITTSIGIASSTAGRNRPDELLRNADLAMYRAKNKGKKRYEVYEPRMSVWAVRRLELEKELRRALERDEFRVYYQPQVLLDPSPRQRLGSGGNPTTVAPAGVDAFRIAGMEALVRWEHPDRGLVLPKEIIPIAEETGLIVPIGQWVMGEACRQAREWRESHPSSPPLTISVNLSARQFQHPGLVQDVARVLQETGLQARSLWLEITESVAMEDARPNFATLGELKGLGVQLGIDDFGTGYSSLSYLKRLPVDFLKIDHSFVAGLGQDPKDGAIVQAVIALAHTLDSIVIGEGVESADQLARLRQLGCDMAQGDFFTEPLPGEAASALLAAVLTGGASLAPGMRDSAS